MNIWFLMGGVLASGAVALHIFGGESVFRRVPVEAFRQVPNGSNVISHQETRVAWHLGSADFSIAAISLLIFALTSWIADAAVLARFIALYFLGYALNIALLPMLTLKTPRTLWQIPQWIMCLVIAVLAWKGSL